MLDAIVIGAGPAGSAASYFLGQAGVKVAVLDRAVFPRDKACGDLLCRASIKVLESIGLGTFLDERSRGVAWPAVQQLPNGQSLPFSMRTVREDGTRKWTSVPRRELDAALLARARAAGATIHERTRVVGFEAGRQSVRVATEGLSPVQLESRLLIVAQGSTGGFVRGPADFFAARAYYSGRPEQELIIRWMSELSPGYAWQFPLPKDGTYNLGLGSTSALFRRFQLARALCTLDFARNKHALGPVRGGHLNTSFGAAPLHADRTLWVGDAAGLVQPHNGEGISGALRSGELAASCVLQALTDGQFTAKALSVYTRRLHREMDLEFRKARTMAWIIRHPWLFSRVGSFLLSNFSLTADEISEAAAEGLSPGRRSPGHESQS